MPLDENGLIAEYIEKCLMVPLNYRKEHPEKEGQIFDCMYEELFSDPIAMVKRIYRKFGLEYTEEFEGRMSVYLENNKQGKYGRHKYSLEEYGFKGESVYQEYKDYMEQYDFGIPDKIERRSLSISRYEEPGKGINFLEHERLPNSVCKQAALTTRENYKIKIRLHRRNYKGAYGITPTFRLVNDYGTIVFGQKGLTRRGLIC